MNRGEVDPRRLRGRPLRPTVLIVCEGEKTEALYFSRFREALRGRTTIKLGDTNDKDPLGLAQFAKTQKGRLGLDIKGGDSIWIVFDADDNSQAMIDAGAKLARKIGANLAMSNPCFELWHLLHFEDRREALDRNEALARLRMYLREYERNRDVFDELEGGMRNALERAHRLEMEAGDPLSLGANPATGVWRAVEELIDGNGHMIHRA